VDLLDAADAIIFPGMVRMGWGEWSEPQRLALLLVCLRFDFPCSFVACPRQKKLQKCGDDALGFASLTPIRVCSCVIPWIKNGYSWRRNEV
jgi:hypothetical protein